MNGFYIDAEKNEDKNRKTQRERYFERRLSITTKVLLLTGRRSDKINPVVITKKPENESNRKFSYTFFRVQSILKCKNVLVIDQHK